MGIYISATSAISPQQTFDDKEYLEQLTSSELPYLPASEPNYRDFLDPRLTRRMARIIKMSVTATKSCLQKAGIDQPGAIIIGTGFGCLQDTEKFLNDILENNEGLLSPTSFIQSTHNTIAGQIALTLGCPNHNFTFVQRGHSFESAFEDAILHLQEGNDEILIGGVDEIIPTSFEILSKTGCVSGEPTTYPDFDIDGSQPTLGEGAAFFVLSKEKRESSIACIENLKMSYRSTGDDIVNLVKELLENNNLTAEDIDAVVMGYNGDQNEDMVYHQLRKSVFEDHVIVSFKNLCGEYFTTSAFGHHLASKMIGEQKIFPGTLIDGDMDKPLNKVLFYNHYKMKYHTLTLLSSCQNT